MSRPTGASKAILAEETHSPQLLTLLGNCPALVEAIRSIQEEVLSLGERRLEAEIRKAHFEKGQMPRQLLPLKIAFWEEFRLAIKEKRKMRAEDIYNGICQRSYWQKSVLGNPLHLAWLIHAPVDETILQKELIYLGMNKLREAFDAPIVDWKPSKKLIKDPETGQSVLVPTMRKVVNIQLLKELHAIVKSMQDRVHGSVIDRKRVETANLHVHASQAPGSPPLEPRLKSLSDPNLTLADLEAFEKRLEAIDKRITSAAPEVLEATTVEVEATDDHP